MSGSESWEYAQKIFTINEFLFVMMAMSAATFAMVAFTTATFTVAAVFFVAVTSMAMMSASVRMKAFRQFVLSGLTDRDYLAGEIKSLVGHWMVDVHLDEEFASLDHLARHNSSVGIHERNHCARDH